MSRLFSRHKGRHCRHGSLTGWSSLAVLRVPLPPAESFTRRRAPLALLPVADDLIPFTPHRHPYEETSR